MKLPNPNNDPIIARINNTLPTRKRKHVHRAGGIKRHRGCSGNANQWRRKDLSISIPKQVEECDHKWVPAPRMTNEHTTYECSKCGMEDGFA